MPSLRQVRAVTKLVGRRATLRYSAVALGASVLAACGKDPGNSGSPGPLGLTVAAFLKGEWRVEMSPPAGEEPIRLTVEITGGRWSIEPYPRGAWESDAPWKGSWALSGSRLKLSGPRSPYTPRMVSRVAAYGVPAMIGASGSLRLVWQVLTGSSEDSDDELRVEYTGSTLHIVHTTNEGTRTELRCERA
ncbi:hypothetical protein GCM10009863_24360 [Streptomyces axinellae]|uniref:Lipocalin-like domain-containing protein n=2 Tax=Streptomyces axinellae TaxID=552788 RepID=A0ABN3Q249_9ACTN